MARTDKATLNEAGALIPVEPSPAPKFPKIGTPIKVIQATFQAETFWPAKLGAELSVNPIKHPKAKMTWMDGRGLMIEWADGSVYCVPQTNVKGFEIDLS